MAERYQPANEPVPEPTGCVCIEGMPRCAFHDPEREAARRARAKAGLDALWKDYFDRHGALARLLMASAARDGLPPS